MAESNRTWMKDFQEEYLERLFLPCSHNSTSYVRETLQPGTLEQVVMPFASSWDACQKEDLRKQLSLGVRVVDFRLTSADSGQMFTVHGLHCMPFTDALEAVAQFIRDPACEKTETVVVRLNEGYQSVGKKKWRVDWAEAARLVYAYLPVAVVNDAHSRQSIRELAGKIVLDLPDAAVELFKKDVYRAVSLKSWHDAEFSTNTNDPEVMPQNLARWLDLRMEEIGKIAGTGMEDQVRLYFLSTPCTPTEQEITASYNPLKRPWVKYTSLEAYANAAWPLVSDMLKDRRANGNLPPLVIEIDMVSKKICDEVIGLNTMTN